MNLCNAINDVDAIAIKMAVEVNEFIGVLDIVYHAWEKRVVIWVTHFPDDGDAESALRIVSRYGFATLAAICDGRMRQYGDGKIEGPHEYEVTFEFSRCFTGPNSGGQAISAKQELAKLKQNASKNARDFPIRMTSKTEGVAETMNTIRNTWLPNERKMEL